MTISELKTIVKNTIDKCVYYSGILDNTHLSKRDVEEIAKPIATLAVLYGYAGRVAFSQSSIAKMRAYLKSLSLVVRIEGEYIKETRELIDSQYNYIRSIIRNTDDLSIYDLTVVIESLIEEAEK